jgi:hypothetical protein
MFAVVVRETGDQAQIDGSGDLLNHSLVPRIREAPGFVSAVFLSDRSGGTLNVLVFETEEQATMAMERTRQAPRPGFIELERADLYLVLANPRTPEGRS